VVSFMLRPFYPRWKIPKYPLYRKLGGFQNLSRCGGEEKNFHPCWKSNPYIALNCNYIE
jgi:hypothetical protein